MKTLLIALAAVSTAVVAAPAFAVDPPAAAAPKAAFSTADSDIGTLLDNPATKAVLVKHMPEIANNPQFEMARSMTLKQIQDMAPDRFSAELLAKIDADLATIK